VGDVMDDLPARQMGLQAGGNGFELGHEDFADEFGFGFTFYHSRRVASFCL
jgi:hypothetical protein